MTDKEFATWDRHKAENLESQRDDALARIDAADTENARLTAENQAALGKANAEAKAALESLTAQHAEEFAKAVAVVEALNAEIGRLTQALSDREAEIRAATDTNATLAETNAALTQRCAAMTAHPDVIAAAKESAISRALADKRAGEELAKEAERTLAELEAA